MNRDEIFELIKKNIMNTLTGILPEIITVEKRLKDLGADSIDRMTIMTMSIEDMGLKIPLVELGRAKDIKDIIEVLYSKQACS